MIHVFSAVIELLRLLTCFVMEISCVDTDTVFNVCMQSTLTLT